MILSQLLTFSWGMGCGLVVSTNFPLKLKLMFCNKTIDVNKGLHNIVNTEDQEKCKSVVKAELKNMHRSKSRNKID